MIGKDTKVVFLEDQRLDQLTKVQLLLDSSIVSTHQTGTGTSKAKTGNVIGRVVVGGVLMGGTGAVIGGLSGQRESEINTQIHSTTETELTAELFFENDKSLYVLLKSKEAFHWLLGFANQPSLTDTELELEKNKAIAGKKNLQLEQIEFELAKKRALELGAAKLAEKQLKDKQLLTRKIMWSWGSVALILLLMVIGALQDFFNS